MTITEFVFLSADQALDLEGADAVKNAVAILKRQKGLEHLVIGKRVEEPVKVLAIVGQFMVINTHTSSIPCGYSGKIYRLVRPRRSHQFHQIIPRARRLQRSHDEHL